MTESGVVEEKGEGEGRRRKERKNPSDKKIHKSVSKGDKIK